MLGLLVSGQLVRDKASRVVLQSTGQAVFLNGSTSRSGAVSVSNQHDKLISAALSPEGHYPGILRDVLSRA